MESSAADGWNWHLNAGPATSSTLPPSSVRSVNSQRGLPMHQLMSRSLEEIALEGREGITLQEVFRRVFRSHAAHSNEDVNGLSKHGFEVVLWNVLRKMQSKLDFYLVKSSTPSDATTATIEPTSESQSTKRKRNDVDDKAAGKATKKQKQDKTGKTSQSNDAHDQEVVRQPVTLDDASELDAVVTAECRERVQVDLASVGFDTLSKWFASTAYAIQVVACQDLRLRALGVDEVSLSELNSQNFDVLEMIGKAHERGIVVNELAKRFTNGNMVKVHYPLDVLIARNLIQKNMVVANTRRFNVVHLKRFVHRFHPSMIGKDAYMEDRTGALELAEIIAHMIRSRNEESCVFADIGRELGHNKRVQERIRKSFEVEARLNPEGFPLELFQARCNSRGGESKVGRKLWCVRLKDISDGATLGTKNAGQGPILEQGIMEQIFALICERASIGTTVPEIRDLLVVPSFKLPYKLAQVLISSYGLRVEKVVVKKNTLYRMYAPQAAIMSQMNDTRTQSNPVDQAEQQPDQAKKHQHQEHPTPNKVKKEPESLMENAQSMREASSKSLVFSTSDDRRRFIVQRLQEVEILQIFRLLKDLNHYEAQKDEARFTSTGCKSKFRCIDKRTVMKIITELVKEGVVCRMMIAIPCRMVRSRYRETQCVALTKYQKDTEAIKRFIARCRQDQEKKIREAYDISNVQHVLVQNKSGAFRSVHPSATVTYKHVVNRKKLQDMSNQARRLGSFFGVMYRIRALHLLLLKRFGLDNVRQTSEAQMPEDEDQIENSWEFSLTEMLEMFSIKEFIQIIGLSDLLSDEEEHEVSLAIQKGDPWDALPSDLQRKVRGAEVERSHRFLRVMMELQLIERVEQREMTMMEALASSTTGDVDEVVRRAVYRTISGSRYRLFQRVRMHLRMGSTVLNHKALEHCFVYCPQFSFRSTTEVVTGRVPLQYEITSIKKALEYWKALAALSVHGGELRSTKPRSLTSEGSKPREIVLPAALRDHNPRNMRTWSAFATGTTFVKLQTARKYRRLPRKRNPEGDRTLPSKLKRATLLKAEQQRLRNRSASDKESGSNIGGKAFTLKHRRGARLSNRQKDWTHEQDLKLMEVYLEKIPYYWLITIPLALQTGNESIAFRSPELCRTKFTWKGLGKTIQKSPVDCMRRIKELTPLPGFRSKLQKLKESFTLMKNPSGRFHEEDIIRKNPSLSALLILALQIIFHEKASYYSALANSLISRWKEEEVKLVWRYLWILGITCTPRRLTGDNQKERGFLVHSRLSESRIPGVLVHSREIFNNAAEYAAFANENLAEEMESRGSSSSNNNNAFLDQEVQANPSAGQLAFELSSMAMGSSVLRTECSQPEKKKQKAKKHPKGFEGHLLTYGADPEDFLNEYWNLKSRVFTTEVDARKLEASQAFSTTNHFETTVANELTSAETRKLEKLLGSRLEEEKLMDLLNNAGLDGLSIEEMVEKFKPQEFSFAEWALEKLPLLLAAQLQHLVAAGLVLQVNGFAGLRYVSKTHADLWLSHPYRFEEDISTKTVTSDSNLRFVFDKDHPVISRPWRHLDGTVNLSASSMLKRKVVNIVMSLPGISEQEIRRKMLRCLSILDTRTLLMELVDDGVLYARAVRQPKINRKRRLFDESWVANNTKQAVDPTEFSIEIVTSKDMAFFDTENHRLVLFPAVNCMQLLGELVSDEN